MRKLGLITVLITAVLVMAATASAANPHFIGDVDTTDQGLTLNAQGSIAGLGNEDTVILITATGVPTVTCTNPSGATQPPGQNPAELNLAGGEEIPAEDLTNGRLDFSVSTAEPEDPPAKAAGCPNNRWDANITDIDFTSATLEFYQGDGCALVTSGPNAGQPNNQCDLIFTAPLTV